MMVHKKNCKFQGFFKDLKRIQGLFKIEPCRTVQQGALPVPLFYFSPFSPLVKGLGKGTTGERARITEFTVLNFANWQ